MILCYPEIPFDKIVEGCRKNFLRDKMENNEENQKRFSIYNRVILNTLYTFIWTLRHDTLVPYESVVRRWSVRT